MNRSLGKALGPWALVMALLSGCRDRKSVV